MTKHLLSLLLALLVTFSGYSQSTFKAVPPAGNQAQGGNAFHGTISMNHHLPEQPSNPTGAPLSLTPDNYRFFMGDSLDGFDFDAAFLDLNRINTGGRMTEGEKRSIIRHKQAHYVQEKFHIPTPLIAERSTPAQRLKEFQELTIKSLKERKAKGINPHPLSGCNNAGFETGDFTGWSGGYGFNAGTRPNGLSLFIKSFTIGSPYGPNQPVGACQPHTLMSAGTDPYSGQSVTDPSGGGWTARLGGDIYNVNYYQAPTQWCWGGSESSVYTG
ncbi:MAG: hypothetical protein ACHQRM_18180, partial [Bacteroidia bacterium]